MLWARDSLILLTLALVPLAAAGCGRSHDERRGLPPAAAWKPPAPQASRVEGAGGGDGARARSGTDPHAGLDMGAGGQADPHAGLDMEGDGTQDPHAGLDMEGDGDDEHGGRTGDRDPHANLDTGGGSGSDGTMAGLEAPDPDRPIDESKFLRGTIRAGKEVADAIRPGSVLFLSAWPVDPNTGEMLGAPVAVAKLALEKLPMRFELTERDMMVRGTRFEGEVLISARVDADGEARTKEPGDVEGRMRARVPAKGLDLVLDTALR